MWDVAPSPSPVNEEEDQDSFSFFVYKSVHICKRKPYDDDMYQLLTMTSNTKYLSTIAKYEHLSSVP
ncbi:hypothetical protein N7463_007678 [Penicillium fimorum]|uniref:Uncharacterized protein n=1 Tax=Penicillium fimorum TaxID=1882269 RepID=A0A9W9XWR0_9EURO|nr:hypothetical protein N7463_007678 [Penicillium fimorum]